MDRKTKWLVSVGIASTFSPAAYHAYFLGMSLSCVSCRNQLTIQTWEKTVKELGSDAPRCFFFYAPSKPSLAALRILRSLHVVLHSPSCRKFCKSLVMRKAIHGKMRRNIFINEANWARTTVP